MLRALGILIAMTTAARAAPDRLVGDIVYDYVDQKPSGAWVSASGSLTLTITFGAKPELAVVGRVSGDASPEPGVKVSAWKGRVGQGFALTGVTRDPTGTIRFKLDFTTEHLAGTCAPVKLATIARSTLYECTFTGFQPAPRPLLPELRHPFILDANPRAVHVVNTMRGSTEPQRGTRRLSVVPPQQ